MSWTHEGVVEAVRGAIVKITDAPGTIPPDQELVADLGIDSLGVMEVVAEIEDEFGLTIEESTLREVVTFGDVVKTIEARLRADGRFSS